MTKNMSIDYYNKNAKKFTEETLKVEFQEKHHMLLKYLKEGSHILDLGCGSGRDSNAFMARGYRVTSLDGSVEMCKIASKFLGQEVICKGFSELDYVDEFDAVWACASLLHLTSHEVKKTFTRIAKALKQQGYIYVSFKYGKFEGERNGRYFTDLTEESLTTLLEDKKMLTVVEMVITSDVRKGREGEKWLNAIIKKVKTK